MTEENKLYFEDVNIGDTWTTPRRTVTEADIVNFAGLSGDYNRLHTDEEFARTTMFGKRIAHGLLGLAISSGLASYGPNMATMAFMGLKWNFKKPIFIGDTICVRITVAEKRESSKGGRGIITWKREVINQRDEVVQEGETNTMVEMKSAK